MSKQVLAAAAAAGLAVLATATSAQSQVVQAGTLACDVAAGIGLVIGSNKAVSCTFRNAAGETEIYDGRITKLGLDIGVTDRALIVWTVFAPSGAVVRGALAGDYVGATAEATLGGGVGANVLVGGFQRAISLQPLSVSGQEGVNVAAGAADLNLVFRQVGLPVRR